jgi:hypothetical protein
MQQEMLLGKYNITWWYIWIEQDASSSGSLVLQIKRIIWSSGSSDQADASDQSGTSGPGTSGSSGHHRSVIIRSVELQIKWNFWSVDASG